MAEVTGHRIIFEENSLANELAKLNKVHESDGGWKGLKTNTVASAVFGYEVKFNVKSSGSDVKETSVNLKSLMNIYGVKHKHLGDFKKIVKDVIKNMPHSEGQKKVDLDDFIEVFSKQLLAVFKDDGLKKDGELANNQKLAFNPNRFNNIFKRGDSRVKQLFKAIENHFNSKIAEPANVPQEPIVSHESTTEDPIVSDESTTEDPIVNQPHDYEKETLPEGLFDYVPDSPEVVQQATNFADGIGLNLTSVGNLSKKEKETVNNRYTKFENWSHGVNEVPIMEGVKEGYIIKEKDLKDKRLESLITHDDNGTYSVYGTKSGDSGDTVVRIRQGIQNLDQAVTVAKQAQSRVIIDRGKGVGTAAILKDIQTFDKRLDGFSFFAPKGYDIDKKDFSLGQFIVMPDESNKDFPYKIDYRSANGDMKSLNFKFKNPDNISDKSILISHRGREWTCSEPSGIDKSLAFLDNIFGHSPVVGGWKTTEILSVSRGDSNKSIMRLNYSYNQDGTISEIKFNPKPPVPGEAGLMQYEEETFSLTQPTNDRDKAIALLTKYIEDKFSSDELRVNEDTVVFNYAIKNTMKEGSFNVITTVNSKYIDLNDDGSFQCGNLSFEYIDKFMESKDVNLGPMIEKSPADYKGKVVSTPLHEQVAAAVNGPGHGLNEYSIESTLDPNVYSLSWRYTDVAGYEIEKKVEMRTFEDHQYIELQTEIGTTHTINSLEDLEYALNLFSSTNSDKQVGNQSYFYIQDPEGKSLFSYINQNGDLRVKQPDNSYKTIRSNVESFESIKDEIGKEDLLPGYSVKCPPSCTVSSTFIHTEKKATVDEFGKEKFGTVPTKYNTIMNSDSFKNISDLKASTEKAQIKFQLRPLIINKFKRKENKKTLSETISSKSSVKHELLGDADSKIISEPTIGGVSAKDEQASITKISEMAVNKEEISKKPKQDELSKLMVGRQFPAESQGAKQHLLNTLKNASDENKEAAVALIKGSRKFEFKADKFKNLMNDVTKYIKSCNEDDSIAPLKPFHMDILLKYCDRSLPSNSLGALVLFLGGCIESEEQWQDFMPIVEMLTQGPLYKDGNDLIILLKEKFRLINGDSSFAKGVLFYQSKVLRNKNATKSLGKIHAILDNLDNEPLSIHSQKVLLEKLLKDENIEGAHLRNLLDVNSYVDQNLVTTVLNRMGTDTSSNSHKLGLLWFSKYLESENNASFAKAVVDNWETFSLLPDGAHDQVGSLENIVGDSRYYALSDSQIPAEIEKLTNYINEHFKPEEVKQEVIEDVSDSSDFESIKEHEDEPKNVSEFLDAKEQKENIKDVRKDRPKPGATRRPPTRKPNQ